MIQIALKLILAVNVADLSLHPRFSSCAITIETEDGQSIPLRKTEGRSYPTLSPAEEEGRKCFDASDFALDYAQLERDAIEWVSKNVTSLKCSVDRQLLNYPKRKEGTKLEDQPESWEGYKEKPHRSTKPRSSRSGKSSML